MTTKQRLRAGLGIMALALCAPANLLAQSIDTTIASPDEKVLSNVVITGQYKPVRPEDAVQRIRVIDSRKIAAMGAQNLRDVLLNEMNISVSQDNVLGSSVSIQGITGQNVKILVDGVPVIGRQNGNVDIGQLNVYNVERIELVEGPMSVNYGTDALAGTINIITRSTVKQKVEAGINTYTESIGKYNVNANAGFHAGKHTVLVSGARNFFDGWDEKEKFNYLDFAPKPADSSRSLQWDAKEEYNASLQYSYRFSKMALRAKSDYFYDIITNRGMPAGYYGYTAFDDYYRTYRFNNALFANGTIFGNKTVSFIAAYNQYRRVKNTYEKNLTTLNDVPASAADQDTSAYSNFNSRATFGSASAGTKLNYEIGYDINQEQGSGRRILNKEQSIGDYALYGSAEYKITDSLTLRAGMRYAYNTAFQAPLIPSLNIKYTPVKNVTIRASYARGFRAPGVKELYFEFKDSNHDIVGNPNLTPERSNNFNVAAIYSIHPGVIRYKFELSSFYNNITDMINLAQPDTTIMRYTYVNIDRFKTQGMQLNFSGEYKNLALQLGGSYIGRYNQLSAYDAPDVTELSYSPELRCNIVYEFKRLNASFSLFGKYTGPMPAYGMDANGNVVLTTVSAYSIVDCSVTKKVLKQKMSVILGCKNFFNTTNVNRVGAAAGGAHSTGASDVSISTGRSLFLGVGYQFQSNK